MRVIWKHIAYSNNFRKSGASKPLMFFSYSGCNLFIAAAIINEHKEIFILLKLCRFSNFCDARHLTTFPASDNFTVLCYDIFAANLSD